MKVEHSFTIKATLRVKYASGETVEYTTTPIDQWRASKVVSLVRDGDFNPDAWPVLAWAAAVREGDSYRQRRQSTDPTALFEAWLETVEDYALVAEIPDAPEDEDGPKDSSDTTPAASPGSSPGSPGGRGKRRTSSPE